MHSVYLALGSNIGDRARTMWEAVRLIGENVGTVARMSSLMESEPWGFCSENSFLNAVLLCYSEKTPHEILAVTQQIERMLGREKKTADNPSTAAGSPTKAAGREYSDRPIDIDILLYDDLTVCTPELTIPHPLMTERDFVMKPLEEIRKPVSDISLPVGKK